MSRLSGVTYDVLVVGGGVYGLTIACDAAQRGLSVALVERGDFGSGASFNHLRTIHGGLRYLQTLDLARARESVRERRALARIAPAAVHPLPFVLPLPRSWTRGALAMRLGFLLDRAVGFDRHAGVPDTHHLSPGQVLSRAEAVRRFPSLAEASFSHAAVWHDYVATEADRLTFSWALAADAAGAVLANYVEATALIRDSGRVVGAHVTDRLGGGQASVAARVVVNAAGAWVAALPQSIGLSHRQPLMRAMNLVTRLEAPDAAIGGRSVSGRNLFLVPWRHRALFGTWESSAPCAAADGAVQDADVDEFIADINRAFPAAGLSRADVTLLHRGVVPAIVRPDGTTLLDGRELIHDHSDRVAGLMTVAGTKYTTARAVAERVTDRLLLRLERSPVPCRTATTPLPMAPLEGDGMLRHAARNEMVMRLEDAVLRRTSLGALGRPEPEALAHAAAVVGGELGWNTARQRDEIDAVDRLYP